MAFPILMSDGKEQYCCNLPLLMVLYMNKEALNSVFICMSIITVFWVSRWLVGRAKFFGDFRPYDF